MSRNVNHGTGIHARRARPMVCHAKRERGRRALRRRLRVAVAALVHDRRRARQQAIARRRLGLGDVFMQKMCREEKIRTPSSDLDSLGPAPLAQKEGCTLVFP